MSDDLIKRLRGQYSVGPDGVYEDRDFGSFQPRICLEAAEKIEAQAKEIEALKDSLAFKGTENGASHATYLLEIDALKQEIERLSRFIDLIIDDYDKALGGMEKGWSWQEIFKEFK